MTKSSLPNCQESTTCSFPNVVSFSFSNVVQARGPDAFENYRESSANVDSLCYNLHRNKKKRQVAVEHD